MLLTRERLLELVAALEAARRSCSGPDSPLYCHVARKDADGREYREEAKGGRLFRVTHGPHGRAFLAVCPGCGGVCCAACRGGCPVCGGG